MIAAQLQMNQREIAAMERRAKKWQTMAIAFTMTGFALLFSALLAA